LSDLMKKLMADPKLKGIAEKVAKFAREVLEEVNRMPKDKRERLLQVGVIDEREVLRKAEKFLEGEFDAEVSVYEEEDPKIYDPKDRARLAKPYRPAIFIE